MNNILNKIKQGFTTLNVGSEYKDAALNNISLWLNDEKFQDYVPQIKYLCESEKWDVLLDCFYQTIPFGTGGRRGLVGIGPNRINSWTIKSSAQGHSQYLIKRFGDEAKKRGVVISYDVRKYQSNLVYNNRIKNPVYNLGCKELAEEAASVYAANGIKVLLFKDITTTPEMSFMVRHKGAVAGDMISASHNPPEYNGKKVVDETGGQLIPPYDEELVKCVVNEVDTVYEMNFEKAKEKGLIEYISDEDHSAYINASKIASINEKYRSAKILFSPFHGTAGTSVYPTMKELGFDIVLDPVSGKPDPKFSSIKFNIPNPEVTQAYEALIPVADEINADIILTTDPDGDRVGLMSKERNGWKFFNGNEIFILTTDYLLEEYSNQKKLRPEHTIVKTVVTSNLLTKLAEFYNVKIVEDLLVGIKYIADVMKDLENDNRGDDFLIGGEESHGQIMGNYCHDKDSNTPAILLGELASKLKDEGSSLEEHLNKIYIKYGYYHNYLTEIRLPGAEGMSSIAKIQKVLREKGVKSFGKFQVISKKDFWEGKPFLSGSDKTSRNLLLFNLKPNDTHTYSIRVMIRPSGTEPKTKIYIEVGRNPIEGNDINRELEVTKGIREEIEKDVVKYCYKILDIDFPDRGFLLFWQLPAQDKMRYFEIEPEIVALKEISDKAIRIEKLNDITKFLGVDPIDKVDKAFKEKYGCGIKSYLELD